MLRWLFGKRKRCPVELRCSVDAGEFRALIRGGQVTYWDQRANIQVHLLLKDVGFMLMKSYVHEAVMQKPENYIVESRVVSQRITR